MKKLLLVFSHPDDESFTCGGLVAKYVASGWRVELVCATKGEIGSRGPHQKVNDDRLGELRAIELAQAAKILGINTVHFLGYRDGKLSSQQYGEIEDKLFRKIIEISPDVVITFDATGISNHPDHIKLNNATTFAFQRYAHEISETRTFVDRVYQRDPTVKKRHFFSQHMFALRQQSFADIVDTKDVPKLYYACMPESVATYLKKQRVIPQESFDKAWVGTPDKFITTIIDIKKYRLVKEKALRAHVTQQEDVNRFFSDQSATLMNQEFFILRMQGTSEVFMGKNDRVSDRL